MNIVWTGRTDGNLEVSSKQLISQRYFWAQVRNETYRSIGIETFSHLDESRKKGSSIIDGSLRPLCEKFLKHGIYYTTNHKMIIIWC